MKIIVFLNLMLASTILISQSAETEVKRNIFLDLNSSVNQNYIRLLNESAALGNSNNLYFAFEDWTPIDVYSKKGDHIRIDSANYHMHDDVMFFKNKGNLSYLFPQEIEKIETHGITYIALKDARSTKYLYYELLVDGDYKLLKKQELVKKKVNDHPMGITHTPNEYKLVLKSKYLYHSSKNNNVEELPRKKNKLIKIFARNRNRMVQYARESDLSPKSEEDLIRLFQFYNVLKDE